MEIVRVYGGKRVDKGRSWFQGTVVMLRGQGSGHVLCVGRVLEVIQCSVEGVVIWSTNTAQM